MILSDVGGVIYNFGVGVATLATSPLNDRALMVRRINVSNPSASDSWTVTVGGREIMRFRELSVGNQHLLRVADGTTNAKVAFWEYCRDMLGIEPMIPVPLGQTLTIASVGGATADVDVEALEVSPGDANIVGLQHYLGNTFLMPLAWFLNAAQSAAGAVQVDTQVAPPWVPPIFSGLSLPVNWKIELLALFLEGSGVNTFSGSANHQSTTQSVNVIRNGVQMFTRINAGIPNRGKPSAAGSANTVFGQQSGIFDPAEEQDFSSEPKIPVQIVQNGGDTLQIFENLQGDLTGGASYANALITAIARVTVPVT